MPYSETISPEAYRYIAQQVYDHSRITLGTEKQALVIGRLSRRLRQLNLKSFDDYCEILKSNRGKSELPPLLDLITTNHTRFFREPRHLTFLKDVVLPNWSKRAKGPADNFRVWSAACSSGEEPYSVGIVLAEYALKHPEFMWQIEASDISTRILAQARDGIYPEERVEVPSPEILPRYFQKGTGMHSGQLRVKKTLRAQIRFHQLNLLQPNYPIVANQHVVFCRNVMIYFDTQTQQELVGKITRILAVGGHLIVGHSESLLGIKHGLRQILPSIYVRER